MNDEIDLEWICEQFRCIEQWADDIKDTAYRCRLEIEKWKKKN